MHFYIVVAPETLCIKFFMLKDSDGFAANYYINSFQKNSGRGKCKTYSFLSDHLHILYRFMSIFKRVLSNGSWWRRPAEVITIFQCTRLKAHKWTWESVCILFSPFSVLNIVRV